MGLREDRGRALKDKDPGDQDWEVKHRPGQATRLRRRTVAYTNACMRLRRRGDPSAGDQMKGQPPLGLRAGTPADLTGFLLLSFQQ